MLWSSIVCAVACPSARMPMGELAAHTAGPANPLRVDCGQEVPVREVDVLIVGGGNAALCAAIEAARAGVSALVLEAAPQALRGGNSRHTRNLRQMHLGPDNYLVGDYAEDEFYHDLLQVTGGETDETLARLTIRSSQELGRWMKENGVRWQPPLRGTLQLSRTNAFFLGGGKALLNAYY